MTDKPRIIAARTGIITSAIIVAIFAVTIAVILNDSGAPRTIPPHPCGAVMVSPDGTISIYGPAEVIDRQTGKRRFIDSGQIEVIR